MTIIFRSELTLFCTIFCLNLTAQNLKLGGLADGKPFLVTPSVLVNEKLKNKTVWEATPFGMKPFTLKPNPNPQSGVVVQEPKEGGETFVFQPVLEKGWTWMAAFNFDFKGKKQNIFYYDSWVATTEKAARTGGRKRTFDTDVTEKVASNLYHIALQRKEVVENEIFVFAYSPIKQRGKLHFAKNTVGCERTIEYDFEAGEAKFIHVVVPPSEYTNVVWFAPEGVRDTLNIGADWDFKFTKTGENTVEERNPDGSGKGGTFSKINIPHTWNNRDVFDPRPIKDSIDYMEFHKRGVGIYKKKLTIPTAWQGRYVKIDFQGANTKTEVFLNGEKVGTNNNGYLDFHFDITKNIKWGLENELLVKVDSRFDYDIPPHTADYNFQGGIYREVSLIVWNKTFVRRPKISTPKVSPTEANYSVLSNIKTKLAAAQNAKLVINIINPYGEIAASHVHNITIPADDKGIEIKSDGTLENPLLWSPSNPKLYRVQQILYNTEGVVLDATMDNFGFRFYQFDANKGLIFNGKPLKMKGVNVHQDIYGKGWANSLADKKQDFEYIKAMGCNYVRLSHYPHHPYVLHLCDSLGILVWEEIPVVNTVGRDTFIKNAVKMMTKTIERDYNRPSVIVWGVGNEYYRAFYTPEDSEYALKCTQAVADVCKKLDPYRPTIQAQNDLVDYRIMDMTDIQGRNRYFGWYGKESYNDIGPELDKEHTKYPNWKMLVSEYGAEGKYGYHVDSAVRFDHSMTYQLALHKAYWEAIKARDFVAGATIWNMFDFSSFAKIGNIPHINQKGMMTYDRRPKGLFYYYQSQWSDEPMVYIWEHTYTHRHAPKGQSLPIEILSNCDEVMLYIDGKSVGKRTKNEGFVWKQPFTEGYHTLKAVGFKEGETVKWSMEIHYQDSDKIVKKEKGKGVDDGY